jgi:hypothetical protein
MDIIDSHTHWGPSVTMGAEVTTEELPGQGEQSGASRIVIFPFPSTPLADLSDGSGQEEDTYRFASGFG